jgi:tetraacyldisaccharide 4'-kinase
MRAPEFWQADGALARLLAPLGAAFAAAGRLRALVTTPVRAPVPVVCVGNLSVGGTGKTPVAIALARRPAAAGRAPHLLSRGYGGSARGPLLVDPARHDAALVGDEPLLLARAAPTWVARDRAAGARAAAGAGAGVVVMDDGLQSPSPVKDLALVVVDGAIGFGNRRVLPAGPLREPVAAGLARAHGVVIVGPDRTGLATTLPAGLPVIAVDLVLELPPAARGRPLLAFAGIGRPAKLFDALEAAGAALAGRRAFPDHHRYRKRELQALLAEAGRLGALLATTEKDAVRLPGAFRSRVLVVPVHARFRDVALLDGLTAGLWLAGRHDRASGARILAKAMNQTGDSCVY